MPRGTLVIGVGGAGRGVLNHLKRTLEQEYGSPDNAGVVLYCIDGPVRDQYLISGEYQIDTSPNSNEFYQLTENPVDAIRNIAQEKGFRYIEDWLQKEDAARVPVTGIEPSEGMGGERVPGRANLFLEVSNLTIKLNSAIASTRSFLPKDSQTADGTRQGSTINIFLVGSQSGGTGAGLLLDVAHLIRKYKGKAWLIGMLILPNGFDAVINSPGDKNKRDAKAFAGIRELHRFQGASSTLPIVLRYSDNIDVSNEQLFDLCFLMDGQNPNQNLSNVYPLYGIVPSASDLILAMVKDSQNIEPNVINWVNDISVQDSLRRFSSYGIHTLIYPDKDLLETFSLRFAKEVYDQITTQPSPPPGERNEGDKRALGILGGTKFGDLAISLANNREMPTKPDDFRMLRQEISFGVEDAPFPSSPVLQLEDFVKKTAWFLSRITNADVVNDCETESKRYLGDERDNAPQTVYGWISYQSEQIQKNFVDRLIQTVTDIFYAKQTDGAYKSRPLSVKAYTLRIASDLLGTILSFLDRLRRAFAEGYSIHSQTIVNGVQMTIIDLQREEVRKKHNALQPDSGKDKVSQADYISASQKLLELRVWEILMKGSESLAQRLYELTQLLWKMVGDPAQGWLSFFESFQKDLETKLSHILTVRSDLADVQVRRYFPSPNDIAEQHIFHDLAVNSGLMGELLTSMSWTFESANPNQTGFDPRQKVDSYKLILNLPVIPGVNQALTKVPLINVITREFRELILSIHSPEELVQYARNGLSEPLSKMTIWDAMHYDYQYVWVPAQLKQGGNANTAAYVNQLMDDVTRKSFPLLSQNAVVGQNILPAPYCLSNFRNVPNAPPNSADELATLFYNALQSTNLAKSDASMSKYIFMINYEHRVPLRNWGYYLQAAGNYFDYCFAYSRSDRGDERSRTSIHLFPEERNAATLELYLAEHHLLAGDTVNLNIPSIGIIPMRRLDISVVRHLGDIDAFRNFCMAYVFNLIPREESERTGPDRYYVDIENPTSTQRVYLGTVWDIDKILTSYLSATVQGRNIREKLDKAWEFIESEKKKVANWKESLRKEILEKTTDISFLTVPAGIQDTNPHPINRDDLILAMKASLCIFAEAI